jgi:glucosamine--fructose-6-phosphate aminotransferase (isomerizing)
MADKNGFPHFMIKEIFEQPRGLQETIAPRVAHDAARVSLEGVRFSDDELRGLERIAIVASGTSRHAGLAGQYMIQELAGLPVDVDYASEYEYRNPLIGPRELVIVITQSGETADTTAAQREAKTRGARTLAISNVEGSTIAREADGVIYTRCGPEVSIASTKAFTAQMACLFLFALRLGQSRGKVEPPELQRYINELLQLPRKAEIVLASAPDCQRLAEQYYHVEDFLFLGRAIHYPIAMDGALKLKETSYIHAEGYPTGEAKHGPNALIDESLPVVMLATKDAADQGSRMRYEKNLANMRSFKHQSSRVIAIASEGDRFVSALADHTIFMPETPELLLPILEIIPLQLFAYYVAVRRGVDVDRPRNLVKSVMQE